MSAVAGEVRAFYNHRRWQEFIAAWHESLIQPYSAGYAKIITAMRSADAAMRGGNFVARRELHSNWSRSRGRR